MKHKNNILELNTHGYSTIKSLYTNEEVLSIINCIKTSELNKGFISNSENLYAIRQLLNTIPKLKQLLFNKNVVGLLDNLFESNYFLTKAIYFDKPPQSNWFVAYHQDLGISVDKKAELDDYRNWTYKQDQYGVQPPIKILEDTITLRIHLDDTTKDNGALKIIPKSHIKGIIRKNSENWNIENEDICEVKQGSIMLMKPLLLHASNKTINNKRRRVIHLEFNCNSLSKPLNWLEYQTIN
jgi:ectoine hydroxylase-related dioxygenase (phytanoyl-CoA dioxygenase family)